MAEDGEVAGPQLIANRPDLTKRGNTKKGFVLATEDAFGKKSFY